MKALNYLIWSVLYSILYMVTASEDDLVDFEFSDLKEIDWNFHDDRVHNEMDHKNINSNMVTFDDYLDDDSSNFDWKDKIIRTALSKALTNVVLRQKFVEVMPILRALSSQQRMALSALISAQINSRNGQELKLDQVRMMFGDDKKLLIPIVYDIANLVRHSARNYLQFNFEMSPENQLQQETTLRRNIQLHTAELQAEEGVKDLGVIPLFNSNMTQIVLDPLSINEELQSHSLSLSDIVDDKNLKRKKRSIEPTEFVHKLIRHVPLNVNANISKEISELPLNTTGFIIPNNIQEELQTKNSSGSIKPSEFTMSYEEVENLAFTSLNGTEKKLESDLLQNENEAKEPLPSPEELISGPRYRILNNKIRQPYLSSVAKRKRVQVKPRPKLSQHRPLTNIAVAAATSPTLTKVLKSCERFTSSMCLQTDDYPINQIMGSIRRHKYAMSALLAEYNDKLESTNFPESTDVYKKKRREDEITSGGMCQSVVRYARPQKARSASGEWKYIVNTGQHTQTLRLEKCTNPQESCSYLAHNYRSHCSQVYNYHRLLSWDKTRGLHVDIFKVPTCCSCQIDGYRQQFPPLAELKSKDFVSSLGVESYSTINDDIDYNDEEDEDDLDHHFANGNNFDGNELLSSRARNKIQVPSPTVGAFLSPPGSDEYDIKYSFKRQYDSVPSSSIPATKIIRNLVRRRPHNTKESRVDLEIAQSENHADKEVNQFSNNHANNKHHVHEKRKRIYSMPQTATSTVATAPPASVVSPSTRFQNIAPLPHQTAATSTPNNTKNNPANRSFISITGGSSNSRIKYEKSKTLLHSIPSASTTESIYSHHLSSAHPTIYYVNPPLYSTKYNATNIFSNPKRINYSYHPIIDFFENNKPSPFNSNSRTTTSAINTSTTSNMKEMVYIHKIPNSSPIDVGGSSYQSRERRIGYGAGISNVESDNAWHPVVVES